jgi:hypothetical protein
MRELLDQSIGGLRSVAQVPAWSSRNISENLGCDKDHQRSASNCGTLREAPQLMTTDN